MLIENVFIVYRQKPYIVAILVLRVLGRVFGPLGIGEFFSAVSLISSVFSFTDGCLNFVEMIC